MDKANLNSLPDFVNAPLQRRHKDKIATIKKLKSDDKKATIQKLRKECATLKTSLVKERRDRRVMDRLFKEEELRLKMGTPGLKISPRSTCEVNSNVYGQLLKSMKI